MNTYMKTMDLNTETEMEKEKRERKNSDKSLFAILPAIHILLFRMKAFVRKAIFSYVIKNVNKVNVHLLKHRSQHLYSFDSLTFWSHRIRDVTKAKRLRPCSIPRAHFLYDKRNSRRTLNWMDFSFFLLIWWETIRVLDIEESNGKTTE